MLEMIIRRAEWEDPETKTAFIESFHKEYFAWDDKCTVSKTRNNCDWVVLPVTSFDMYYGGSYFSKRILSTIPEEILERQNHTGTCRYRITDAFRL